VKKSKHQSCSDTTSIETLNDTAVHSKSQGADIDLSITYPGLAKGTQTSIPIASDNSQITQLLDEETGSSMSTSVAARWGRRCGKDLDMRLQVAIHDKLNKDKSNATKSRRRIDLKRMGQVIWAAAHFAFVTRYIQTKAAAHFAFVTRYIQTKANAIVFCTFRYLLEWKPELFKKHCWLNQGNSLEGMCSSHGSSKSPLIPMLLVD
jgi:hypothetical protein